MGTTSVADAIRRLASGSADEKDAALKDLAATDGTSPQAARAILDAVTDQEVDGHALRDALEVHREAVRSLRPALLADLRSPEASCRVKAVLAIRFRHILLALKAPRDPEEREAVLALAADPDAPVRREVCGWLGWRHDPPESVLAWLEVFLRDPDPEVRVCAAIEVRDLGRRGLPLAVPVARLLADGDPWVRGRAAKAIQDLAALGPGILKEPVPGARGTAPPVPTVRDLVGKLLADADRDCVLAALKILGSLSPLSAAEVRALEGLAGHADSDIRSLARVLSFSR